MTSEPNQTEPEPAVDWGQPFDAVDPILRGLKPRIRQVLILGARGLPGVEIARHLGYKAAESVYRVQRRHRTRLGQLTRVFEVSDLRKRTEGWSSDFDP